MNTIDRLLKPDEAAELLGLSSSTLSKMRLKGDGPAFVKLGKRRVAYRVSDLAEWSNTRRFRSTSEYVI